jgi:hypothetical protein
MCLRFKFCTHQRVCVLNFLKNVKFVAPYCTYCILNEYSVRYYYLLFSFLIYIEHPLRIFYTHSYVLVALHTGFLLCISFYFTLIFLFPSFSRIILQCVHPQVAYLRQTTLLVFLCLDQRESRVAVGGVWGGGK